MDSSEQVFDEGLQVEWSKSLERKMQWEEEVYIIQEERFILFRRRCDKLLFTMSGSNSGGSDKILGQQLTKIPFNMEFQHIQKSKHIIASVWPRVLLWPGYPFCNWRA